MNIKKLLALLLSAVMCLSLVPAAGAENAQNNAALNEKRIERLLEYASDLHEMKELYAPKVDRAEAMSDPYANARIIVKYAGELDYSGSVAHVDDGNNRHVIQYRTSEEAKKAAEAYLKVKGVEYAAPDQIMSIAQQPHTNSFLSWGFGSAHVDAFNYNEWILEEFGDVSSLPEVLVAVLDTGVDSDHEFFVGRLASGGYDFVDNDNNPEDEHYHGTHVSGTVIDGTLPNVKVMGIRVLDADGYGDTSDIVSGMEYANLHGCKVANLSLRGPRNDQSEELYSEAINNGADNGTVYCIASGNDGGSSENYLPGAIARSFTVAAHDSSRAMAYFSNTGPSVDITAPGVGINSAAKGGGYRVLDGTSMATPHVSAACAMVFSFNPNMDADAVVDTLKSAAVDEGLEGGGTGLLNVTDLFKYDPTLNGEGSTIHFTSSGSYPWATDETSAFSTNSGVASSTSVIKSRVILGACQQISFEYKVSSEQGHDYLRFKANGQTLLEVSGESGWQTFTDIIPAGGNVDLVWEFTKDASGNAGSDKAWIRNVVVSKTINTVINANANDPITFENNGNYPWIVDGDAAKSGNAGVNNSVSEISATRSVEGGLTLMFYYKTECGSGDKLQFLVNGNVELEVTQTTGWTGYEYYCESTGSYTFAFRYVKNGSGATGADCAWLKGMELIHSLSTALNVPGGHLVFANNSTYPWVVEGDYARSDNRGAASTSSSLGLTVTMRAGDTLSFRYKVSSESNYDWLYFYVNNSQQFRYSGTVNWTQYTYTAPSDGTYTFEWRYSKDSSVNSGDDCGYLDDVCLTTSEPEFIPGDCNSNGVVEVTDALLAMRYAMGVIGEDALDLNAMDVDGNGQYNMTDAMAILRMAMGII